MNPQKNLIDAYVELLKIQDNGIRIQLQRTYCFLRDKVAELTNQSSQFVQEKYEEVALVERYGVMMDCVSFNRFIGLENKQRIKTWPADAKHYWDQYKYAKTQD